MASNESEAGRKGKASLRATEAGFQITDSPDSASRQEKKQDGGCPRRSAAAAPESLSFADAVERRQADIVRLGGEEEGDEEENELEAGEVVDKQQGSGKGGEGLLPRAPRERLHWPRARRLGARPANYSVAAAHAICYPVAKKARGFVDFYCDILFR